MWALPGAAACVWAGILLLGDAGAGWGALLLAAGAAGAGAALRRARRRAGGGPWREEPALGVPGSDEAGPRGRILRAAGFPEAPARRGRGWGARAARAALAVSLLAAGGGWASLRIGEPSDLAALEGRPLDLAGTALSDVRPNETGWGLEARVRPVEGGSPGPLRVWLSGRGEPPAVEAGQPLLATATLRTVRAGSSGFDDYLGRRGVVAAGSAARLEVLGPPANPALRLANALRRALARGARRALPAREAGLLLGLTIGDTSGMDPEVEEDFRATGLGHLVAVSGSNVAMALAPVLGLAALARARPGARVAAGLAAVGLFALITRWEPSVLRATVMASLAMLGALAGRPRDTAALLGGATLLLLLADPRLAHSLAFRLSVAATAGIALGASRVAARLGWLPRPVAVAAGATLGAQAAVTPLLLAAFGVVPGATLPANLLAFPAVGPAFLGGVAASGAALAWEPLGRALGRAAALPLAYLAGVADRLARLPLPSLVEARWVPAALALLALAALGLAVGRRRGTRAALALAGLLLLVPLGARVLVSPGAGSGGLTVVFLDVGQGDAALVRTPEGVAVLVDAGPEDDLAAARLAALGVGAIDLAVASHAHADHLEGFPAVLARHEVGLLLEPGCPADSPSYARLLEAARAEGVPVWRPRGGERLRLGGLLVEVLGPDACSVDSPNDDSLVLRLSHGGGSVLFPGDAEVPAQADLLADGDHVRAVVLKVPHHGAATSDPGFFRAVGAAVAVVSVGPNDYGHPVPETLRDLEASGAAVLRTDRRGDLTLRVGPGGVLVESAR